MGEYDIPYKAGGEGVSTPANLGGDRDAVIKDDGWEEKRSAVAYFGEW